MHWWRRQSRLHLTLGVAAVCVALAAARAFAANGSVAYTYDALGRVASASYDTNVCVTYTYDANGNRTAQTIRTTTNTSTGYWGCFNWGQALWGSQ